jgi:lactoylglutathione lyase
MRNVGAITLFVADPERSKGFYAKVFDAPVVHEDADAVTFRLENTLLNLLTARAAGELIEPASVATDSAARSQLTVWVDDADAICAQLGEKGVALLNGPVDREWGVRTAAFADPDGHVWEIAQPL